MIRVFLKKRNLISVKLFEFATIMKDTFAIIIFGLNAYQIMCLTKP